MKDLGDRRGIDADILRRFGQYLEVLVTVRLQLDATEFQLTSWGPRHCPEERPDRYLRFMDCL